MAILNRQAALAAAALSCAIAVPACGTQGDASILPDRWPRSGLAGYSLLDAEQPYAMGKLGWDIDEPLAVPPSAGSVDGDRFVLWGRMNPRAQPAATVLCRAELRVSMPNGESAPDQALAPTLPWEGGALRSPTVLSLSEDRDERLLLYQGEQGDVGAADLPADAAAAGELNKLAVAAPLLSVSMLRAETGGTQIGRIAAVADGDRAYLFFTVDDREVRVAQTDRDTLSRWRRDHSIAVPWQVSDVLLPATAVLVPPGDKKALPAERISDLAVRRQITPAGRTRWDVILRAQSGKNVALVAATAYGVSSGETRIGPVTTLLPLDAPLTKPPEGTPGAATWATLRGRMFLFYALRTVQSEIAVAGLP